jgi:hypothetical protein
MSTLHSNLCARYGEYLSLNSSPRLFSGLRELNGAVPLNRSWASSASSRALEFVSATHHRPMFVAPVTSSAERT